MKYLWQMLVAVQILPEAKGCMCMHGSTRLAQAMYY